MYKNLSRLAVIALLLDSSNANHIASLENPDEGLKVEKPDAIVYDHKGDIKQAYVGHFPKSKWVKEAPAQPEPREYTPEETAHRRDILQATTGHVPHISDKNANYDKIRQTGPEHGRPTQISYDPLHKAPTYNEKRTTLVQSMGDGEGEDSVKSEKPDKIVYDHPGDIKSAYAGHFPKSKWIKEAAPTPEPREYTPEETAHRRDILQATTGHVPHLSDRHAYYDKIREEGREKRGPTQISYDPLHKPPTYNEKRESLAQAMGEDDDVKVDKPDKIIYDHPGDIKSAYAGHFPKSKWIKEAPPVPEPREYTPEETAHRKDIMQATTGHVPHITDRNAKYDQIRQTGPEHGRPTSISYDPLHKPPTYNEKRTSLVQAMGDGEEDAVKSEKPDKIVYDHPGDIKSAYAGHFPKSKWIKEAPPVPEPREYTPEETAHRRDIMQATTGHVPHITDRNAKYDKIRQTGPDHGRPTSISYDPLHKPPTYNEKRTSLAQVGSNKVVTSSKIRHQPHVLAQKKSSNKEDEDDELGLDEPKPEPVAPKNDPLLEKSKQLFNDAQDLEKNLAQVPKPTEQQQPAQQAAAKPVEAAQPLKASPAPANTAKPAAPVQAPVAATATAQAPAAPTPTAAKKADGSSIAQQVIQRMMAQKKEKEDAFLKPFKIDFEGLNQQSTKLTLLKKVQEMAVQLEEIKHESPSLALSQQISTQQQKIADIILKTAEIADNDQQNDKDVEAEAQKVIKVANLMTEGNVAKLDIIEKKNQEKAAAAKATDSGSQAPAMTAEQQLDAALGVKSQPKKDLKSEVLSQIFKVMDDKEKMHNEVMFGMGGQSQSMVQQSTPSKPLSPLEQNSSEFMSKISTYDFGIKYD